jgi:hypothetical protein
MFDASFHTILVLERNVSLNWSSISIIFILILDVYVHLIFNLSNFLNFTFGEILSSLSQQLDQFLIFITEGNVGDLDSLLFGKVDFSFSILKYRFGF